MNTKNLWCLLAVILLFGIWTNSQGPPVALGTVVGLQFLDHNEIAVPANPAAGVQRWYASSVTHRMACVNSTGSDCTTTPAGAIGLITLGACPAGFSEVSALDGKTLIGTLAAHGNVGTTGGSDTVTPTFTGSVMPTHAHALPFNINGTSTINFQTSAGFGTGPVSGEVMQLTPSFSVSTNPLALSQGVSAGTPAGTNSTEDNRSAFVRVIFCSKN